VSTLNVDKVDPSTGTALEIGTSGDTITVPSGATLTVTGTIGGHLTPASSDTYDLGTSGAIWRDIYTGDLNLTNQGKEKGNDIDGTKGSWIIQEGKNDLFIMNKVTGKKFKFKLEEVT
jgi:hypothetical protein